MSKSTGEAAAAKKNREIKARLQIKRLGIPHREWPEFVRKFYTSQQERTEFCASNSPPLFQPPDFDRLNESLEEWAKAADAAWKQHRDRFMDTCRLWVTLGVDEEIPPAKNTRGPGRKGRRLNALPEARVEWAARRLNGVPWKEISNEFLSEDQVKKAASEMLKLAGWPTKVRAPKPPKLKAPLYPKPLEP